MIIFHIISIFIFYKTQKKKINKLIKKISFAINNWKLVTNQEKEKMQKEIKIFPNIKKNINKSKRLIKIMSKLNLNNKKDEKDNKLNHLKALINKKNPPKKINRKIKVNIYNNNHYYNNYSINNNDKDSNYNIRIFNKEDNEEKIIKKSKKIMEYNDEEKNNLKYELALKFDKRSYFEYYLSLIKTKHPFVFSFCYNKDYNSKIIKIDLFFISFILNYEINALFFSDDTMHKIYEDKGSFNFVYQLPQIVYS